MDMIQPAETSGFTAIAGGLGCTVALRDALPGLAHRHGGQAALAVLAGADVAVTEHRGCICDAKQSLGAPRLQAARGLLAVGGLGYGLPRSPVAVGNVADQAVVACLTGCIHNGAALRQAMVEGGALLRGGGQAELLLHLMAQSRQRTLVNRLVEALERMVGGFSLALITEELAVAVRDPRGFRPLWIGARGGAHLVASDPAALAAQGVTEQRELAAGEVALLEPGSPPRSLRPWGVYPRFPCALEWLDLSRPAASFEGLSAFAVRQRLGRALAASSPAPADAVATLPGVCAAAGMAFAQQAGLPMAPAFDPVGMGTDGPPDDAGARVIAPAVRGRSVALVFAPNTPFDHLRDASKGLQRAGAKQVHLRCFGPLQAADCPYGIDLAAPAVAGAGGLDPVALQAWLRVDSLSAAGLEGLATALGREITGCCSACLGGPAPLLARDAAATPQLPLFEGAGSGIDDSRLV